MIKIKEREEDGVHFLLERYFMFQHSLTNINSNPLLALLQFLSLKLTAASTFYDFNSETDALETMQVPTSKIKFCVV